MDGAWAVERRVWGGVACAVDVSSVVQISSAISGVGGGDNGWAVSCSCSCYKMPLRSLEVPHSTKYFVLGPHEIFYFVRDFGLIT